MPGCGGIAFDLVWRSQDDHGDGETSLGEQARGHHAIAAIVAAAAESGHAAGVRKLLPRNSDDRGRGVAHQVEGWDGEALCGGTVASLHLGCRENPHSFMVVRKGGANGYSQKGIHNLKSFQFSVRSEDPGVESRSQPAWTAALTMCESNHD